VVICCVTRMHNTRQGSFEMLHSKGVATADGTHLSYLVPFAFSIQGIKEQHFQEVSPATKGLLSTLRPTRSHKVKLRTVSSSEDHSAFLKEKIPWLCDFSLLFNTHAQNQSRRRYLVMAPVPPGNQTGFYYVIVAGLPFQCSWQRLKDFARNQQADGSYININHALVYPDSTDGWVRVKGKSDFQRVLGTK
jgi:hypothetical protein